MRCKINQRSWQAYGKEEPFGKYVVVLIGDCNQIPLVGENPITTPSEYQCYDLIFGAIEDIFIFT